ncbi:hypothetical protein [Roseivivax isoporae]|uniref:Uncharacterized protein n=1 Tax=Roseivivax isoporae LMG 25204 TaxID=1449351 RepID=X7FB69_9RHOB|nr:hypothetical protein [Roseivivax isoporae]ETX29344.1 hypothetical protein RISW2_01355 [Roseivivax isoporae LMG 25204]
MQAAPEPVFEATISPLLIALLRGSSGTGAEPAGHATVTRGSCPGDAAGDAPPPAVQLTLRRDGERPLRFDGTLLWCDAQTIPVDGSPSASVQRQVELYRCAHGGVVARIVFDPSEGMAARPVFRAAEIASPEEFRQFLDRNGARDCFAVAPGHHDSRASADLDLLRGPHRTVPPLSPIIAELEGSRT